MPEEDSNRIFNGIQLLEKNVEPENRNQDFLNRNFQLGKIDKTQFGMFSYRMQRGIDFLTFPREQGGFLTAQYGAEFIKKNEALLVLSGSVGGFVRDINQTNKSDAKVEQQSSGMFGSMFKKT